MDPTLYGSLCSRQYDRFPPAIRHCVMRLHLLHQADASTVFFV